MNESPFFEKGLIDSFVAYFMEECIQYNFFYRFVRPFLDRDTISRVEVSLPD
jgi:hypothetical protein